MRKFLLNNWIVLTIGTALIASMVMAIRNKTIIDKNSALLEQSQKVKGLTEEILSKTMHGLDLGARGFALTKDGLLVAANCSSCHGSHKILHSKDPKSRPTTPTSPQLAALAMRVRKRGTRPASTVRW